MQLFPHEQMYKDTDNHMQSMEDSSHLLFTN